MATGTAARRRATAAAAGGVPRDPPSGFTPNLSVEWTRFASSAGSTWEIAALGGLRWYGGHAGRLRGWLEVAAGLGQFVYENDSLNGRVDAGLRLRAAGGLDFAVDPLVSVGLHVAVNDQWTDVSDDERWIEVGCGVTFPF